MVETKESVTKGDLQTTSENDVDNNDVATESSSDAEDSSQDSGMPLFKYARLVKKSQQDEECTCTCAAMGKVVLAPDVVDGPSDNPTSSLHHNITNTSLLQKRQSDLVWNYPHHVLALGYDNGKLCLVDARTGVDIVPCSEFKEYKAASVVDVTLDASGTFLASLYANGMCTIWELRYAASFAVPEASRESSRSTTTTTTTTTSPVQQQQSTTPPPPLLSANVFTNFLTNLQKGPYQPQLTTAATFSDEDNTTPPTTIMPTLKTTFCQASRISYPSSFGQPTCFAIDPAYKKRREKTIMVGFQNASLIMTKKGFFQRRTDVVLYQGTVGPIQAICWRGALVAWADDSGIKLLHVDSVTRIAHIDRPTGARSTLYPTLSNLTPTLVFETSESLLCAWGDCLMTMAIQERIINAGNNTTEEEEEDANNNNNNNNSNSETSGEQWVVKRRKVQCTMAWELDCVACGVVPLDDEHVAVLGLVPIWHDDDEKVEQTTTDEMLLNDLELHIMSRSQGTVIYADALPLIHGNGKVDASCFSLQSSFALPRMEDAVEAEEERALNADDDEIDFQMTLFPTTSQRIQPFKDSHKKWSLKQLAYEDVVDSTPIQNDVPVGEEDDAQSVDSDDYSFVLRPTRLQESSNTISPAIVFPPLMVITSPMDAVLVRAREVDDAVSHALSSKRYALALRRALVHKTQLREYDINQLIDQYLQAVLRMNNVRDARGDPLAQNCGKNLSIRRVKLAAQAMPMLLGGHTLMWEKWVDEFSKIPGGLFVLREELPVRDPILPAKVYENVLATMLAEIEGVLTANENDNRELVQTQMMGHFLSSLITWGPTRSLRKKIQFHKYEKDRRRKKAGSSQLCNDLVLLDAEKSLERRLHQTSSGYLQLPSPHPPIQVEDTARTSAVPSGDDTSDSLFVVDRMMDNISAHVPLLANGDEGVATELANNHAALEALAELNMMKGQYDTALRCFLAIGCLHVAPDVSKLEDYAILSVNNCDEGGKSQDSELNRYGFVLAMIEYQHLHQCLLDDGFLSSSMSNVAQTMSTPLVALMQLVGLDNAGDFLVEHCVPPPVRKAPSSPVSFYSRASDVGNNTDIDDHSRHETLAINLVADQLRPNPKLFHWYLHQVLTRKPEMYVKFPRTAVPPRSVTELHRSHLELYIEYTDKRDSAKALSGIEIYNLERMTTPLLSFLKAALPLGGIRPDEARRLLQAERTGNKQGLQSDVVQFPHYFAIELAYVIEHFGKGSEENAKQILNLYLQGSKSLMLAVSYAQRNTSYSPQLWTILIEQCLQDDENGSLFGSLLECAALCGADLAHLVTQIPQGMQIEGLRPRLVAAVADYRWKLKMHEAASIIGTNERAVLLRELTHRSKRGMRFSKLEQDESESAAAASQAFSPRNSPARSALSKSDDDKKTVTRRPLARPDRYRISFAVPLR